MAMPKTTPNNPTRLRIITVLPEPQASTLRLLMDTLGDLAGSHVARSYPPHVTLRTGALVPETELESYVKGFRNHLGSSRPFEVETDRFVHQTYDSVGVTKHFFGYTVKESMGLMELHTGLIKYDRYMKRDAPPFWPHLSVAYDDISDEGGRAITERLKGDPGAIPEGFSWGCDSVSLYRKVDGMWNELSTISLNRLSQSSV